MLGQVVQGKDGGVARVSSNAVRVVLETSLYVIHLPQHLQILTHESFSSRILSEFHFDPHYELNAILHSMIKFWGGDL